MAKSMIIGLVLAILFGGIGLAYAGRVGLGILLFIIEVLGCIFSWLIVPGIIAFIVWVIAIVLTVKTINKANGTNY